MVYFYFILFVILAFGSNIGKCQNSSEKAKCPSENGVFKNFKNSADCGSFIHCVDGEAFPKQCPQGLAFSQEAERCEWPDQVSECDSEAYIGFKCPTTKGVEEGQHPLYSDPQDCRKFYVCVNGKSPRMLGCGVGAVFNEEKEVCDEDPKNVKGCENYYPDDVMNAIRKLKAFDNKLF